MLSWFVEYPNAVATCRRETTDAPSKNVAFKKTSTACRQQDGLYSTATQTLSAELKAPATEGSTSIFGENDAAVVAAAVVAAAA